MTLIATDLDRTLLPNGEQTDNKSLEIFYGEIKKLSDLKLVYVTGRNLELYNAAKAEFGIEDPDYLIGSVGTEIFKLENGKMEIYEDYVQSLKEGHPNWNRDEIVSGIRQDEKLYLQEDSVQNDFKVSYYTNSSDPQLILDEIEKFIRENRIKADVVYSVDPIKNLGLIDILPENTTKKGALEFLMKELNIGLNEAVFAGDSGNDISVLTSGIRFILVKNSREEIKAKAIELAEREGLRERLFIAGGDEYLDGNYASGILEGLRYFKII